MNYGSEPADQVVRYSLEGAEFALRISGTAAKNFFIFAQAVLHDSKKTHGKTHLIRLLKEQKPLKFFTVDKDRMHDFARAAKAHGLLFCPIRDKMDPDHIEIAILQDDASKANRIIDKLHRAHRTGRHGKFIFHTAELQPGTGRILTAQVFDVVFVGIFHRQSPFKITVSNQCWVDGHARVPVRAVAVQRGHSGLR